MLAIDLARVHRPNNGRIVRVVGEGIGQIGQPAL
jgi:hypothetical protein